MTKKETYEKCHVNKTKNKGGQSLKQYKDFLKAVFLMYLKYVVSLWKDYLFISIN